MREACPSSLPTLFAILAWLLACAPPASFASADEGDVAPARAALETPPVPLTITVLDLPARVGGQAVLISDSSGTHPRYALIDGGEQEEPLVARLRELGVDTVVMVVLSHPHADHYGGLAGVLRTFPIRAFAWNGDTRTLGSFQRLMDEVERSAAQVLFVEDRPRTVTLSGDAVPLRLILLPPSPGHLRLRGDSMNNRSIGVRIERGRFAALVPGDAEHGQLDWWTRHHREYLAAEVLVASHHGSDDANATARRPRWYTTVTPQALLVSSNGRQHPYGNVLEFAHQRGVATYCTHTHGELSVRVEADGRWRVETGREASCTPGVLAPR